MSNTMVTMLLYYSHLLVVMQCDILFNIRMKVRVRKGRRDGKRKGENGEKGEIGRSKVTK